MFIRILSISRRTDIPAFYGQWFIKRVRAGWFAVPNPFNAKQVSRIELRDGQLIADLARMAGELCFEIQGCAETIDLRLWGVRPGKCIDNDLMRRVFGLAAPARKDRSQRRVCGCIESRDIDMYDSCTFGCAYCYATRSFATARRHRQAHDPASESLLGRYRAPPATSTGKAGAARVPVQGDLFG
ncbi:hypothetical protein Thiowin_01347 [Thiorhodovibrio winogradskyi]|uniref:DUF1848 domain-containing protein n=1 Tax=Thiorhodovibrio winogradskyi TaxID=77007 RepID=A0ABZ0S7Z5_9GAMM|nr:DUF1848 family protein [Thiorhodovibrio winogradskyi]